ncbi:hypothetical protein ABI59_05540 [Acidobacteria bacterium Mor1]|nr:hypothetical protein ABI59_05540 [Acidobacteria bacterium Mor1]
MFPFLVVTLIASFVTMALALTRASLGPTTFDRILGVNMFGTKTVLFISLIAFVTGRRDFIDLALLYALMNFIGVIAVLRFSKYKQFSDLDEQESQGSPPGVEE